MKSSLQDGMHKIHALECFNKEIGERVSLAESSLNTQIGNLKQILGDDQPFNKLTITESADFIQDIVHKVKTIVDSNCNLVGEVDGLKINLSAMSQKVEDLDKLNTISKTEIENVTKELDKTTRSMLDFQSLSEKYRLRIEELSKVQEDNERLLQNLDALKDRLDSECLSNEQKQSDIVALNALVGGQDLQISTLDAWVTELMDAQKDDKKCIQDLSSAKEHAQALNAQNQQEIDRLNNLISDTNQENTNLRTQLSQIQTDNKQLHADLDATTTDYNEAKTQILDLNSKIAQLEQSLSNQYLQSQNDLQKLTETLNAKTKELQDILDEKCDLAKTYDSLTKDFVDVKKQNEDLTKKYHELDVGSKQECKQLMCEIKMLNDENLKLLTEKSELFSEFTSVQNKLQNDLDASKHTIADLKISNTRLQSEIEVLTLDKKSSDDELKSRIEELQTKLQKQENELHRNLVLVQEYEDYKKVIALDIQKYQDKIASLEDDLNPFGGR
ncbi:putative leucine-rich repeat-containing protein DDB_G0290503 [Ctenocephalides felis]|uniref:putative leucine-rich repeat-containing protein DDB_G0290503 n=1 Tax=Ctenocephalides felis TaxID=7515 RepID=UPI000E6E5353|nr:putative leucine-rich repeat-containing protein DDB_G0290503 [Ctenocephalides felis]